MKKTFLLFLTFFLFFSYGFSNNQVLLEDRQIDKFLNTKKLCDVNGKKLGPYEIYRCRKPYISEESKGYYFVFSSMPVLNNMDEKISSAFLYVRPEGENRIKDILRTQDNLHLLPVVDPKTVYGFDYLKFDNYGRAYFSAIDTASQRRGVAMFDPETSSTIFYSLSSNEELIIDFEITEDGRYILVHSGPKRSNGLPDKHNITIFDSKSLDNKQVLFEFRKDHISQIHYSNIDNGFYFIASYEADENLTGTFVLLPVNGEYKSENLLYFPNTRKKDFEYSCADLVKDSSNQKIYASFYSDYGESKLYELIRYEDRIDFQVPVHSENIYLRSNNKEKLLTQDSLGIFIRGTGGKYYSLLNEKITFYKSESDYKEVLEQEMYKAGKYSSILEYKNQVLKTSNIILLITASVLFAALFIILLLNFREIRKKRKSLEQSQIRQIQENEKARISREIHDTVVQDLRAVRVKAENLESTDNINKNILIDDITGTIVKLRNICYSLTPAELASGGESEDKINLVSIIDTLCRQFKTKTNIPCIIQLEENLSLPQFSNDTSTNIIRVFQEILNNIEKHSYATKVSVLIRSKIKDSRKYLVIFVIDDGVGCDLSEIDKIKGNTHFGIRNMKDRVNQIGAEIEFFSMPEQGMKVKMVVEIKND